MKKFSTALLTLVALLTLSSIALIVSVSAAPTAQEEPTNFTAQLNGDQEVPPRTTDATGQATFQLRDETQLDFTLNTLDVKHFVAAHIHCAPAGENGAVGATLLGPMPPGLGSVDIFVVQGAITAPDAENGCEWADLAAVVEAMRSSNTYVNVHTDDGVDPPDTGPGDFPGGEIRGQIEAAAPQACHSSYREACLDPNAEDYDCEGGSGDGPLYTGQVKVVGPDEFELDHDNDGIGCEE
jgi:CHRD domain